MKLFINQNFRKMQVAGCLPCRIQDRLSLRRDYSLCSSQGGFGGSSSTYCEGQSISLPNQQSAFCIQGQKTSLHSTFLCEPLSSNRMAHFREDGYILLPLSSLPPNLSSPLPAKGFLRFSCLARTSPIKLTRHAIELQAYSFESTRCLSLSDSYSC